MQVGDLVEYIPGTTAIDRYGVVVEVDADCDGLILVLWNSPDTATKKNQWWTPMEKVQPIVSKSEKTFEFV